MITASKTIVTIALCAASGAVSVALGQENDAAAVARAQESDAAAVSAAIEEIIVLGRNRAELRSEILRAQDAALARFNEINSTDEFDIHCPMEEITGSSIPRRECRPNFWVEAEVDMAQDWFYWVTGSAYAGLFSTYRSNRKVELIEEELRRLAIEDQQFRMELIRLAVARRALDDAQGRSTADPATRQVPAGADGLPYGAANVVAGRAGRQPWTHALTRRTFTLAHVIGELREIEVECGQRNARLEYEIGVEWTIPDGWEQCTLVVDAARGTTFGLYEFE